MITEMTHHRMVAAPPETVYRLIADVTLWPVVFEPTVHVQYLHRTPTSERFQLWASVAGQVRNWVSGRQLDPEAGRITFRQERSHAPIKAMGGVWSMHPVDGGARTEVVLDHDFAVTGDDALTEISRAVDANSERELAALARVAELGHPVEELIDTFTDTLEPPVPVADCYEFINRADRWPDLLPHVGRVELTEDEPGVQLMEMDTLTADGNPHTTRSVRLCFPDERIVYKQLIPPAMLIGHSGEWAFAANGEHARVAARHTVAINPVAACELLGADSTLADARAYLRDALGRNSRTTLEHAGTHARARQG